MRKFFYFLQKHSQTIFRIFIYVISVALLIYIYPREGSFPFEFQKGKQWMHNDYYAPFDFPIKKSDKEIKAEKDSILKEFRPYFNYQEDVVKNQIKKFDKVFNVTWANYSTGKLERNITEETILFFRKSDTAFQNQYKTYVVDLLEQVYNTGIVQLTEQFEQTSKKDFSLVIVKNKVGEEHNFTEIFTPLSAYEYIISRINAFKEGSVNDQKIVSSGFFKDLDINEFILPNLTYNEEASKNVKEEMIKQISMNKGMFLARSKVIGKGEIVDDEKYNLLTSLKFEYENKLGHSSKIAMILLGHALIISSLLLLLLLFIASFRREVYYNNLKYGFLLLMVVAVVIISSLVTRYEWINLYALPFALLPIIIKTFYDSRLALFVHIVCVLLVGFMAPNGFEFTFINIVAGSVSIISHKSIYKRGKLFNTAFFLLLTYSILYTSIFLLQGNDIKELNYLNYWHFTLSASLILLAYPLIFVFEKLFGFLSDITLVELSDTNQHVLRQLNEKAPGTFQHSLQVANLAEEAAYKIGANPLLVRAGALYHDIGKMHNPMYFIENLASERNPHEEISLEASAKVIIDHVTRGIEIAHKYRLPEQIIDFIRTHHGTTTVQYFFISFKKQNPGFDIDKAKFTYPGPIPYSKETALVMMADSVEAASRSIKGFNREIINELVDNIIQYQMEQGQYDNTNITYKELTIVKEIFKRKLMNIYHVRLEYPEMT
jgi:putative nucleotidyltransferase with HDIG domain